MWLKEAWIEWLGPERIFELYAGTEAQAATVITGVEWLEHRGSVGRPLTGEMMVADADGVELPPGEQGEVWMRAAGDHATYRYVGAEPRQLDGGWESLGDMGWFDEDGYLYLGDRMQDMILSGGSNIYPAEVEAAIQEHPAVRSVCVIGLPDEDRGNVGARHRRGRPTTGRRRAAGVHGRAPRHLQAAAHGRGRRRAAARRRRQGPPHRAARRAPRPLTRSWPSRWPHLGAEVLEIESVRAQKAN